MIQKKYTEEQLVAWKKLVETKLNSGPIDLNETPFERDKRIKRLEDNPEEWFKYYFGGENVEPAAFHKAATKRILAKPEWYEVRMWSRESAKTTRTMYEVLYMALTKRKKFVLFCSSSFDNAVRLLMPYRAELELNPRIKNDYGIQRRNGKWTAEEFTTRAGVTFRAVGSDQPPRGAKNEKNVRPDVLLFDDIDTDADCRNPTMINKTWDWIQDAAIGTRSIGKPTTIIFCGNRIAVDCCVVRACKYADYVDEVNIVDKNGNPSWPEKNTKADIDRVLSQKSYASAQKEYFNNPITEGAVFKEMAYKTMLPVNKYDYLVCYTDPSYKEAKSNDYKATALVGYIAGEYHVLKAFVDQTSTAKMIDWHYQVMDFVGFEKTAYYYMEEVFLQELIISEFYTTAKIKGRTVPIRGDKRKKDHKFTRIEALLEPLHRNGKLYLNLAEKENPHMKRLDEQFVAFAPGSRAHDDAPDAVEGAIWLINQKLLAAQPDAITIIKRPPNTKRF